MIQLDNSFERFRAEGKMRNIDDLWQAIHDGAVQRVRPITMTTMTTSIGRVPLLWASGAGADTSGDWQHRCLAVWPPPIEASY